MKKNREYTLILLATPELSVSHSRVLKNDIVTQVRRRKLSWWKLERNKQAMLARVIVLRIVINPRVQQSAAGRRVSELWIL